MEMVADATGPAVELQLELRDRNCFFVEASSVADCRVVLEHMVHRSDGQLLEYFTIEGAPPQQVFSLVEESTGIDEARLISRGVDGGLFEFVVSGQCVTTTLADTGAIARSVVADRGVGDVIADVPGHVPVRQVVEQFTEQYPSAELVARRNAAEPIPVQTERGVHATMAARLTEKQQEALQTAYRSGYFSWPRRSSATDCADILGIAQPTFSQHIRAAQEKVIGQLFEETIER